MSFLDAHTIFHRTYMTIFFIYNSLNINLLIIIQNIKQMKKFLFITLFVFAGFSNINAQTSCDELLTYVKSKDFGMRYSSFDSDAIRQVSFHEIRDENYKTYYFAIVQFTSSYKEYIYQVNYDTKGKYTSKYRSSAGEAFWNFIHPYRKTLGCAPEFD